MPKKNVNTKGMRRQDRPLVVADIAIASYVSQDAFMDLISHHLKHREKVGHNTHVSLYDVGRENDPCIVVSDDDKQLITAAFKDGMSPMLDAVIRAFSTVH